MIEVSPGRETGNSKFYKKGSSEKKSKDEEKVPLKDSLEKAETYSTSSTQTLEILKGIDLDVTNGQLVGVVGAVGCGKSSVLSALLNEVKSGLDFDQGCRKEYLSTVFMLLDFK